MGDACIDFNDLAQEAFESGGRMLATSSRDKTVKIWDTMTGRNLATFTQPGGNVYSVCWSPCGNYVCAASKDKKIYIWKAPKSKTTAASFPVCTWGFHTNEVRCVSWADNTIMSASDDENIAFTEFAEYRNAPSSQLVSVGCPALSCAFSKDGRRAVCSLQNGKVILWKRAMKDDIEEEETTEWVRLQSIKYHNSPVHVVKFSDSGKYFVCGSDDTSLSMWKTKNVQFVSKISKHGSAITGASFCQNDKFIATGSTDSIMHLFDPQTGQIVCSYSCNGRLCALDATVVGGTLIFAAGNGSGVLYLLKYVPKNYSL